MTQQRHVLGKVPTLKLWAGLPKKIISEIRNRASTLFKKFTILEISYSWAGANANGKNLWVGRATVMEDI